MKFPESNETRSQNKSTQKAAFGDDSSTLWTPTPPFGDSYPFLLRGGNFAHERQLFSKSFVQSARLNQRSHSREDRLFFNPLLLSYRSYVKPLARQSKWDSKTRDAGPIDQIIRDLTPHLYPLNGRQDAKADSRAGSAGKVNYLLYYSITQRSSLRKSHLLGWKNGQRDGAWVRFQ